MKKDIFNISVFFKGTKGKERKIKNQSVLIEYYQGIICPDLESFKNRAIETTKGFKILDDTLRISASKGYEEDGMLYINLFPEKSLVFKINN